MRQYRGGEATEAFFAFRQKSLFITGRTSIGCPKYKTKHFSVPGMFICLFVCLFICMIQHRNWPLRSTMLNAQGTNASPDGLCTRTHTTKPSLAGFAVIRLELIEPGAATCVYQAKACSPTDQPVGKFKDGLGINMTIYENLLYFNISHHVRSIAWSGVSAACCPQRRSRPMPSRTHSSNLHVIYRWSAQPWGSAVGLNVSARCSEAIRSHLDGWISVELQLCCCRARNKSRVKTSH